MGLVFLVELLDKRSESTEIILTINKSRDVAVDRTVSREIECAIVGRDREAVTDEFAGPVHDCRGVHVIVHRVRFDIDPIEDATILFAFVLEFCGNGMTLDRVGVSFIRGTFVFS